MAGRRSGSKPSHVSPLLVLHCSDSYLSSIKDAVMEIGLGSFLWYMLVGNTDPPTQGVHQVVGSPSCSGLPSKQFTHKY